MARALCIFALSLALGELGAVEPVRLALIEGRDASAPRAGLTDLVVAELTAEKHLELLDRAETGQAVRTREIELSGLLGDGAVAVGKLLFADLFVTIERSGGRHRMTIVETQTGVALGGWIETHEKIEHQVESIVLRVRHALTKLRVPRDDRIYVGVMGFQSEELGSDLDGRADALSLLLATDLNQAPEMIVLDRDHLDRINEERDWTALKAKMATSVSVVRGGIRRANGNRCQITFFLQRPGKTKPLAQILECDWDLDVVRSELLRSVRHHLRINPRQVVKFKPLTEASLFAKRAKLLKSYGKLAGAVRALECVYALVPTQETRLDLSRILWSHGKFLSGKVGTKEADEETHGLALRRLVRSRRLQLMFWKTRLGENKPGPVTRKESGVEYIYSLYRLPSEDPKLNAAFKELTKLRDEVFATEMECMRKSGVAETDLYYRPLREYIEFQEIYGHDQQELADAIRKLCNLADRGPDKKLTEKFYLQVHGLMMLRLPQKFADSNEWIPMMELFEEWIEGKSPIRRAMGSAYKFHYIRHQKDPQSAAAGIVAIDEFLGYLKERAQDTKPIWHITFLGWSALPEQDRDPRLLLKVLDALVEQNSPAELAAWINANQTLWLGHMDKALPANERTDWLKRARDRLQSGFKPSLSKLSQLNFKSSLHYLEQKLGEETTKIGKSPWDDYEISKTQTLPRPSGARQLSVLERHGGTLVALWVSLDPLKRHTLRIHASSYDLQRNLKKDFGSVSYRLLKGNLPLRPLDHLRPLVFDLEYDGKRVYAVTRHLGLSVFLEDKAIAIETPSDDVTSIAAIGERLYLAFEEGAIYTRDPDGTLLEIASSRSVAERNPFDGGRPYKIDSMLGDPGRKRVWMNCQDTDRFGLWFHDLQESKFERAPRLLGNVGWHRGSVILKSDGRRHWEFLLDPNTGKFNSLFGSLRKPDASKPMIDSIKSSPCGLIGDHLIHAGARKGSGGSTVSGGETHHSRGKGGLFLHTAKGEPAWLGTSPEGQPLQVDFVLSLSEDSLLVGDRSGKFRVVSRKMTTGG
jgi:hypothetical protein